MARQELEYSLDVEFVAISEDEVPAWRGGLLLLLQLLREEKRYLEANDGIVDVACVSDDGGVGIALLPMEVVVEG